MRNPFTARRPWAAFLVALLLHPFVGMLYLGRAKLAGCYFLLQFAFFAAFLLIYPHGFGDMSFINADALFETPLTLAGALHAAVLAWKAPRPRPWPWFSRWYTVIGIPAGFLLLLFANQKLLFPGFYLMSGSMTPTLASGDYVLSSRIAYDFRAPDRGDAIVFHPHHQQAQAFIKRIIAIPGDRVELRSGIVILNGKPLTREMSSSAGFVQNERIGAKVYSIQKDPKQRAQQDDVAVLTVPPGQYYVLGDNRDNSLDSRFADFGLIPREEIIGPVMTKFYDATTRRFLWRPVR